MGAEDLIANGKDVAIIDYHSGDPYENTASAARISYLGISGFPTAMFDGGNAVVGGNHTNSMYSSYLPKYNQRIAIPSDFTLEIVEGSNSGLMDYELNIEIENVGGAATSNLLMHVAVTESDIQVSWQGQTEINSVERLMAPNHLGTSLDFSGGDLIEETINFTLDPTWVNENMAVVVFIQNNSTKEVHQAIQHELSEFPSTNVNDAALTQVIVPQTICESTIAPKVMVSNYGLDNLTSLDIVYDMNGEPAVTYSWSGDLGPYEYEMIELDAINFTLMDNNTINVHCENPNGQDDEFPGNNDQTADIEEAQNVPSPVKLVLKLDDYPEQTSWELTNSQDEVLYSGGSYTTPQLLVIEEFTLDDPDCYSFTIYDEGGDGLTGVGSYKLAYEGPVIFAQGAIFGYEDQVQFGEMITGVEQIELGIAFDVYPNPVKSEAHVFLSLEQAVETRISVFNSMGEQVFVSEQMNYQAGEHTYVISADAFMPGIYFIRVDAGTSFTKKIIVN